MRGINYSLWFLHALRSLLKEDYRSYLFLNFAYIFVFFGHIGSLFPLYTMLSNRSIQKVPGHVNAQDFARAIKGVIAEVLVKMNPSDIIKMSIFLALFLKKDLGLKRKI